MGNFNPFGGSGQNGGYTPPKNPADTIKKHGKAISAWIKVLIVLIVVGVVAFNSVYILNSGSEAVVTTFGAYTRTETEPGLKLKIPFVEDCAVVDVQGIRRMEFGYNSVTGDDINDESTMLTGDECLVNADWTIQYRVVSGYNYLYHVEDVEGTFRIVAESAYRRVVASHPLDDILTNQKDVIQSEVMEDLQEICSKYEMGILVTGVQLQDAAPPNEVKDAFLDVTSAKEDKESKINGAKQYENEKLPLARGDAEKIINDAEAYAEARINEAKGLTSRYLAVEEQYRNLPGVTRTRMYLEMISDLFPKLKDIYILDPNGNTVEFLTLNGDGTTTNQQKAAAATSSASTSTASSSAASTDAAAQ